MKSFLQQLIAVVILLAAEAWFLHGLFGERAEFQWNAFMCLLGAFAGVILREPIMAQFAGQQKAMEHDKALFEEFQNALPFEPTVRFLRDHDFGGPFREVEMAPLVHLVDTWDNVGKEFIDVRIEKSKRVFIISAHKMLEEVLKRTAADPAPGFLSVYPEYRRAEGPRTPDVLEDARILNEMAPLFVSRYEAFIRLCRNRLAG